jgi:hypothetical protein
MKVLKVFWNFLHRTSLFLWKLQNSISSIAINFIRLSDLRLHAVEWQDDSRTMNWKEFWRKSSWLSRGINPEIYYMDWRKILIQLRWRLGSDTSQAPSKSSVESYCYIGLLCSCLSRMPSVHVTVWKFLAQSSWFLINVVKSSVISYH